MKTKILILALAAFCSFSSIAVGIALCYYFLESRIIFGRDIFSIDNTHRFYSFQL